MNSRYKGEERRWFLGLGNRRMAEEAITSLRMIAGAYSRARGQGLPEVSVAALGRAVQEAGERLLSLGVPMRRVEDIKRMAAG